MSDGRAFNGINNIRSAAGDGARCAASAGATSVAAAKECKNKIETDRALGKKRGKHK